MNRKKLDQLKARHAHLHRNSAKTGDLVDLATSLGRKAVKRGKHPMYESEPFPNLFALSIPFHGGAADVAIGTKRSILTQLEDDLSEWEGRLRGEDYGGNENNQDEDDQDNE